MRVLLAVAQVDIRLGLELLLDAEPGITIVGSASESEGMLALIRTACPELVVLEWGLPGRPGPEVLAQARACACPPTVVVLGRAACAERAALAAGADAYVLRGDPPEQLLDAVWRARDRRRSPEDP